MEVIHGMTVFYFLSALLFLALTFGVIKDKFWHKSKKTILSCLGYSLLASFSLACIFLIVILYLEKRNFWNLLMLYLAAGSLVWMFFTFVGMRIAAKAVRFSKHHK